jgi:hypothetical protein
MKNTLVKLLISGAVLSTLFYLATSSGGTEGQESASEASNNSGLGESNAGIQEEIERYRNGNFQNILTIQSNYDRLSSEIEIQKNSNQITAQKQKLWQTDLDEIYIQKLSFLGISNLKSATYDPSLNTRISEGIARVKNRNLTSGLKTGNETRDLNELMNNLSAFRNRADAAIRQINDFENQNDLEVHFIQNLDPLLGDKPQGLHPELINNGLVKGIQEKIIVDYNAKLKAILSNP